MNSQAPNPYRRNLPKASNSNHQHVRSEGDTCRPPILEKQNPASYYCTNYLGTCTIIKTPGRRESNAGHYLQPSTDTMSWTSDKLTPYPGQRKNSSKLGHDISMHSARNHLPNATATTLIALSYSLRATHVGPPTMGNEIQQAKARNPSLHSNRRNPANVTTSNHQRVPSEGRRIVRTPV